jgi:hypothetical protein
VTDLDETPITNWKRENVLFSNGLLCMKQFWITYLCRGGDKKRRLQHVCTRSISGEKKFSNRSSGGPTGGIIWSCAFQLTKNTRVCSIIEYRPKFASRNTLSFQTIIFLSRGLLQPDRSFVRPFATVSPTQRIQGYMSSLQTRLLLGVD